MHPERLTSNPEWLPQQKLKPAFLGFDSPQSNTTYCPNQFFDVVLPHYSRGVVRISGYLLYKTLAWNDGDGRPFQETHAVSYRELIEKAGVSRGALKEALKEAERGNFIRRVKQGHAWGAKQDAESSEFELKWSADPEYVKDPKRFQGFHEGPGNRTYIPNQFFTWLLPNEPLAVIKVVGAVIRFSIGFESRYGFRRQRATLSYSDIQRYSNIAGRHHLSRALIHAIASNYILQLEQGTFDPNAGRESKAAIYGLRWVTDPKPEEEIGSKRLPVENQELTLIGSKRLPAHRFKTVTGIGSKREPEERFNKVTDIQIKQENKILKQQQAAAILLEKEDMDSYHILLQAGFDERTAAAIALARTPEQIKKQIEWLPRRHPTINPLGMLRRAIAENWTEPVDLTLKLEAEEGPAMVFARHFYAGYGGNTGAPVASPSRADLLAAEAFIDALLKAWPDPSRIEEWGRMFGEEVATSRPESTLLGLTLAIRHYGDKFVVRVSRGHERHVSGVAIQNREAYEGRFKAMYFSFLAEEEARLQKEHPADYQAFLRDRIARREGISRGPLGGKLLQYLDTAESRLRDFQHFFRTEVPDFWVWDKQFNHQQQAL
jgi:hypothetical protein